MKVHEALRWASLFLEEHHREQPVAEILLQHHMAYSRVQLLSSLREALPVDKQQAFIDDIKRHVDTGVPVQHLTGKEVFYGRDFSVSKDVLIPRPETEELIEGVLQQLDEAPWTVVDLGTGSGIIAITLKLERPDLTVHACDISEAALSVASQNATRLQADVNFHQGDFMQPILDQGKAVDIIVSNPPYIPYVDKSSLSDTVKNFDPELALFAEDNGLAAYHKIVMQAKQLPTLPKMIAFEIGYQQGEQVSEIIKHSFPTSTVDIRQDINGKDRMVFAVIPSV